MQHEGKKWSTTQDNSFLELPWLWFEHTTLQSLTHYHYLDFDSLGHFPMDNAQKRCKAARYIQYFWE